MARLGDVDRVRISGIDVLIERKRVKNIRLRICPPDGAVRVSAPVRAPVSAVAGLVNEKLGWIEKHRARFSQATSATDLEYVSGEVHYVRGAPLTLKLEPGSDRFKVVVTGAELVLRGPVHARTSERAAALERWHRAEAKREAQRLVAQWEPRLGVAVSALGMKRMTTRWGTCNSLARRVWLNTELIKRPPACFEYVVVHELAHILVADHSARFWGVVAKHLPEYRAARAELDRWPIWAHGRVP
ncbi:MAG: M48 family metallopeptidase [Trueperaceae bacterium]|nr:M48 family metallopeptidase [Trueperaceae bacterium]